MEKNIIWYIHEYGNKTVDELPLNEVDALIFSQLAYLDYHTVLKGFSKEISFSNAYDNLMKNNSEYKGIARDNAKKVLFAMKNKKRYKNIIFQYYQYMIGENYQFGAISILIPNQCLYLNFEGTDATVSGWKEDFCFAYTYPTKSQALAGTYINEVLKNCNLPCIITGHSKGGNLALTGAMNANIFRLKNVLKIYSFDGPGLREKEFYSLKYKVVRKKFIHMIPEQSFFGVLFKQDNTVVVKSYAVGIMQHSALTWKVDQDHLVRGKQSNLSKNLSIAIEKWLHKYNESEREEITKYLFSLFETNGIKSFPELRKNKTKIINIIKSSVNMSKETKLVLLNCIQVLIGEISSQIVDDNKQKFLNTVEELKKDLFKNNNKY